MRISEKIRSAIHEFGWVDGAIYSVDRALSAFSRGSVRLCKYYIMEQSLEEVCTRTERAASSGLRDKIFVRVDGDRHQDFSFPVSPAKIQERFTKGYECWALMNPATDEVAAYAWIASDAYQEDQFKCLFRLPADATAVWDFDVYVSPKFRLSRAFQRLWFEVAREYRRKGVVNSFSRIAADNKRSLKVHEALGSVRRNSLVVLTVWTWQPEFDS